MYSVQSAKEARKYFCFGQAKEGNVMDENNEVKTANDYDLGTFRFLRVGWWVWHVVAIGIVFYLGYLYGGSLFR